MTPTEDQIEAARAKVRNMRRELEWIAAFAEVRAKDDSKIFARVNRGALRHIAERARAALSLAQPYEAEVGEGRDRG